MPLRSAQCFGILRPGLPSKAAEAAALVRSLRYKPFAGPLGKYHGAI